MSGRAVGLWFGVNWRRLLKVHLKEGILSWGWLLERVYKLVCCPSLLFKGALHHRNLMLFLSAAAFLPIGTNRVTKVDRGNQSVCRAHKPFRFKGWLIRNKG